MVSCTTPPSYARSPDTGFPKNMGRTAYCPPPLNMPNTRPVWGTTCGRIDDILSETGVWPHIHPVNLGEILYQIVKILSYGLKVVCMLWYPWYAAARQLSTFTHVHARPRLIVALRCVSLHIQTLSFLRTHTCAYSSRIHKHTPNCSLPKQYKVRPLDFVI